MGLVHDYLVHTRGGERVFEIFCGMFPNADVYTLVARPEALPASLQGRGIMTSFVQALPGAKDHFRKYFPLYPLAARSLDLRGYDLVISSSSAWAHGVRVGQTTKLICYCHSPFRYIWSHYKDLASANSGLQSLAIRLMRPMLRRWDLRAARRVDKYVANSRVVQRRIADFYGRESAVIAPPVDLRTYVPSGELSHSYFLIVSALMRYKRIDIAVEAFNQLGLTLKIVGVGEDEGRLRRMARSNIQFLGRLSDSETARLYRNCRAFVFTAEEDFGLTPLEAMASGRPVVAYKAGGALETVIDGATGVFFMHPVPEALAEAITRTSFHEFDSSAIRAHAERFGVDRFVAQMTELLDATASLGNAHMPSPEAQIAGNPLARKPSALQ